MLLSGVQTAKLALPKIEGTQCTVKSYFHLQVDNHRDSSELPTSRHSTVSLPTDGYTLNTGKHGYFTSTSL